MVLQAVIGSLAIHVIFIVGMLVVGYLETRNFKSNIDDMWDDTGVVLQDKVVFGKIISHPFGLLSVVGVTVILGFIIVSYKKLSNINNRNTEEEVLFLLR